MFWKRLSVGRGPTRDQRKEWEAIASVGLRKRTVAGLRSIAKRVRAKDRKIAAKLMALTK